MRGESNKSTQNQPSQVDDYIINQITVLRALSQNKATTKEPKMFEMEEIIQATGMNDEREIQRYLFILEGQKLVTPLPEGDLTSKNWQITSHGLKTLKSIQKLDLVQ